MKHFRILSVLMAFCMVIGTLASLCVSADEATDDATEATTAAETAASTTAASDTASGEDSTIDYVKEAFYTADEKLATMQLRLDRDGYELYYESYTGEVAVRDKTTGNVMFSNPYDVALTGSASSDNVRNQLLSQIIIQYNDNNTELTMLSYVEAAQRGQISVRNIRNGIRVEYAMGRQETRKLVPYLITKERMDTMIRNNITDARKLNRFDAYYELKDPFDESLTEQQVKEMQAAFPATEKYAVYVASPTLTEREKNLLEGIIKQYCPDYNFEALEYDHNLTEYEGSDSNPVNFKLSLEYYLDESGLSVRLPANGIRFDESTYSLTSIRMLPFMGAGSSEYTGYTMIPDGSGALVRFEDILKQGTGRTISGKLYGQDYAYYEIKGANQEVMRLPVFGLVEDYTYRVDENGNIVSPRPEETTAPETTAPETPETDENGDTLAPAETEAPAETDASDETEAPAETDASEETADPAETDETGETGETTPETKIEDTYKTVMASRGFLAILEEGDALASIYTDHGGNVQHKYNTVFTEFNPRPKDSYNLASVISVGENATWTVVSERKYTGSYRIRYIMLTDADKIEEVAKENASAAGNLFEASYVGMANAYRAQLLKNGTLTALQNEADSVPLYIETLGVMKVQEKVLSVPVTRRRALTTFDDIKTMYSELKEAGITNLNFRLNGFANEGISGLVPYKVKFEKAAGGDDGYSELVKYAEENNFGLFPEFEFSYASLDKWFDGFSLKRDGLKTIDNRYTTKRTYSATYQFFTSTGSIAISPSVFSKIFGSMQTYMTKLGVKDISVSTLGSDLNSDFDKKEPYNREDSKSFVTGTLSKIKEAYKEVMVDGGNAYTLAYVDHVLNVSLDSSNYTYASESIPFFGLVFHGYLNFAGTPTNMAGDVDREILKLIENGASPYFILAMQNTEKLKEYSDLSRYYSIKYSIWKDDLIKIYNEVNTALADVMYSPLKNHEFLIGERIPTQAEAERDQQLEEENKANEEKAKAEALAEAERLVNLYTRKLSEADAAYKAAAALAASDPTDENVNAEALALAVLEAAQKSYDDAVEALDAIKNPKTDEDTSDDGKTEEKPAYNYTKYTSDNGMIVRVTYENGVSFILNYNNFDITVEGHTVHAYDAIKIDSNGNVVLDSVAALRKGTK